MSSPREFTSTGEGPRVSVVIPVFNSSPNLEPLYKSLISTMEVIASEFEVIMVEDCGGDDSWTIISALASRDPRVRGIKLNRNYGQHNALLCGMRAARYELIVTMDDDLQHPVEAIKVLLDKLDEGYDVVYGTPIHEQHGLLRDLASQMTKLALKSVLDIDHARNVSAFRALRTRLRAGFKDYQSPTVSVDVLLAWTTSSIAAVEVNHRPRFAGRSNYNFPRLARHAMNLMTGFSAMPLQIASFVGFGLTMFGVGILAWVVGRYLVFGSTIPGFPFLASIISIFSGAQLFALGIFGEYLARIHFRTMNRPPYFVRAVAGIDACGSSDNDSSEPEGGGGGRVERS